MGKGSALWGFLLILIGGMFLLNSFNIINIDVWGLFWPIIIIWLGIGFLWGSLSKGRRTKAKSVNIPLGDAQQANIVINYGGGKLTLKNKSSVSEDLLTGTFYGGLEHFIRKSGESVHLVMRVPLFRLPIFLFPWGGGSGRAYDWEIALNPKIIYTIHLKAGACDTELFLDGIKLSKLKLVTGASSTKIHLPKNSGLSIVEVSAGAASVSIEVPHDVGAKIRITGALIDTSINRERFPKERGYFISPEYESATNRISISVEAGVSSINIR